MKTWIICNYGYHHVQDPITCHPIAKFTLTGNELADKDLEKKLEAYCKKYDVCAFGENYYKNHDKQFFDSLPTIDLK